MRIYTLNVRQGARQRASRVVSSVEHHSPDLAVMTEFRLGQGGELLQRLLNEAGYIYQAHSAPPAQTNSVLIASKLPMSVRELGAQHHRLISVQVADLCVTGVYLPLTKPKLEFWMSHFQPALDELFSRPSVVVGDFNTGDDRDRESKTRFYAEGLFSQNLTNGWVNAWHALHEDQRDYTWRSHVGNGFLIDHLWLSPSAKDRLKSAFISHAEREAGVSDHSALVVDLLS